jgi:Tfp pilus assembly protein PilO
VNEKKLFLSLVAGGALLACGLGAGAWFQRESVLEAQARAVSLTTEIADARKRVSGLPKVEREVIVLRALSDEMKRVLPDEDDVNNLVRTLNRFSEDAKVRISGLKKKNTEVAGRKKATDFDRVAYTITLEGDAFQFLDFLDMVEGHSRFMNVPTFRLQAARRTELEKDGVAGHQVTVDVETYVYEPKKDAKPVKIEGLEGKRELLVGEIERRKEQITVASYSWRGARGRRDPFVDPRTPVQPEAESGLSVQVQTEKVGELIARAVAMTNAARVWRETLVGQLEADVRTLQAEGSIVYVPAQRRLQLEVVDVVNAVRAELSPDVAGRGPSEAQLKTLVSEIEGHVAVGRWQAAMEAWEAVDDKVEPLAADPVRGVLVQRLQDLIYEARAVVDFDKLSLRIGAVVIIDGHDPVATINGRSVSVGDAVGDELVVHGITREEVEFVFRGVVLARRL